MISVDDYRARILADIASLTPGSTPLLESLGLVVADDIFTTRPMPGFDNSSMDGYAVRSADFADATGEVTLAVVDDLPAGAGVGVTITAGCAARIMTGAPVPPGPATRSCAWARSATRSRSSPLLLSRRWQDQGGQPESRRYHPAGDRPRFRW